MIIVKTMEYKKKIRNFLFQMLKFFKEIEFMTMLEIFQNEFAYETTASETERKKRNLDNHLHGKNIKKDYFQL